MPYVDIDTELAGIVNGLTNNATDVANALTKLKNALIDGSKDANIAALAATTGAFSGAVTCATTLGVTGVLTASGGITMDGSDIDLVDNKITASTGAFIEQYSALALLMNDTDDIDWSYEANNGLLKNDDNTPSALYFHCPFKKTILGAAVQPESVTVICSGSGGSNFSNFHLRKITAIGIGEDVVFHSTSITATHEIFFTDDGSDKTLEVYPADALCLTMYISAAGAGGANTAKIQGFEIKYKLI